MPRYSEARKRVYASRTPEERFWEKVDKSGDCWLWLGYCQRGYGRFMQSFGRKGDPLKCVSAHRFAYELLVGEIPGGMTLDHLCGVKRCVNPAHLDPCTQAENHRRAVEAGRVTGRPRKVARP